MSKYVVVPVERKQFETQDEAIAAIKMHFSNGDPENPRSPKPTKYYIAQLVVEVEKQAPPITVTHLS